MGVLMAILGGVFAKILIGVLEDVLAEIIGKISIDVLVEVLGGALIEVSMGVLEAVLVGKIEGVLAEILSGNVIIFSISSFLTSLEKLSKVILIYLYGLKKHERMLGYKLVLFNILSVFKKGKSSCFWRISSDEILKVLLADEAKLRRI